LFGFSCFEEEYEQKSKTTYLNEVISELCDLGWLDDLCGEYAIHATSTEVLKRSQLNQPQWFPELANCLSINYFTKQHSRLKDNLFYEGHSPVEHPRFLGRAS